MPFPHQLPRYLTAALLVASLGLLIVLPVEAKGKKARRTTAQAKSKSRNVARSARGRSSRRNIARRGKRNRNRVARKDLAFRAYPANFSLPDTVEVIENGYSDSDALARWQNMPKPSNTFNSNYLPGDPAARVKRVNVRIDQSRVLEIQQALASRGFYRSEMSGIYDDETVDAMRQFQASERIPVTGYPTAHALKRLGLAKW
jgi:hypothetical protein